MFEIDLYVNDLISEGNNFEQVALLKDIAIEILNQAGFTLHQWHSNFLSLEEKEVVTDDQMYAEQQLGVKLNETKMLDLLWKFHQQESSEKLFMVMYVIPSFHGMMSYQIGL